MIYTQIANCVDKMQGPSCSLLVEDERRSMFLLTLSDLFGKSVELLD